MGLLKGVVLLVEAIGLLVLVAGCVAFVAFLISGARWEIVRIECGLAGAPATALQTWQVECDPLLARGGYLPTGQDATTLSYTRTYIPGFAIAIAICLFPFGLVALIARRDARLTVRFEPEGEDTLVTISGYVQHQAGEKLRSFGEANPPPRALAGRHPVLSAG